MVTQMGLRKTVLGIPHNDHISDFWNLKQKHSSPFEAFVPIQNGCDKFCTFCAVPYTRGREVSRPSNEILYDVEQLINNNYKSITLLGQNVNSYGLDKKGGEISFGGLLKAIGELGEKSGKEFWVYFTSPHPRDMEHEVFEVIARYKVLAKQIHLPLQSGDDFILMKMNRNHSVDKYRQQIEDIRTILPSATIFTDIIVGFTGETNEQFENTRNAVKEFKFNMAYIAKYSPRPGAASSRWDDDVQMEIKKKRHEILSNDLKEVSTINNKLLMGKQFKILITGEGRKAGLLKGYTEGRIPIEVKSENPELIGKFIEVEISYVSGFSIAGEIIKQNYELKNKALSGIEF
jgi:tRNA-2-methylthio-N6-dimethylallyladenosine synthase